MYGFKRKRTSSELAKELKKDGKRVALFGAGRDCLDVIGFLYDNDINVSWVIDNSPRKRGLRFKDVNSKIYGKIKDIRIITPSDLALKEDASGVRVIITALQHYKLMNNQLLELGFTDFLFHYEYLWSGYRYDREESEKIDKVYSMLEDDSSRMAFKYWLRGVTEVDMEMFAKAKSFTDVGGGSYVCPSFFLFSSNEIFVDCGAFTGDTVEAFLNASGGRFEKIYAFEPNRETFGIFCEKFAGYKGIKALNCGVADTSEEMGIDSYGVSDAGTNLIKVRDGFSGAKTVTNTIDSVCGNDIVSYIKMDIEGFEMNALRGAEMTIRRCKPKLAISVYHLKEDIYSIPLFIKELVPEYKLFFRAHCDAHIDAILYALPT